MRAIVDLIGDVVTAMKPAIDASYGVISGGGATVTVGEMTRSATSKLYVGQPVKLGFSGVTVYATITTVAATSIIITLPSNKAVAPTSIEVVLNYHHGHWLEIVNTMKENTHVDAVKYEQFPAICLIQDIAEKHSTDGAMDREASLTIAIINATKREYSAAQRYDYNFDPVLIPLYERFIEQLSCNGEIQVLGDDFDYTERVFFGKTGVYGSEKGIFNDYVDAIEINNLKIKTLKFN